MKKSDIMTIPVSRMEINSGQLRWLPRNPRDWTKDDIEKMQRSLKRDPDFVEERPVLVTPGEGDALVVFAHNLLVEAAKRNGRESLPGVIYEVEDEEKDQETIRRRAIIDNGQMGRNNADILANEWPYEADQLVEFGYHDFTNAVELEDHDVVKKKMEEDGLDTEGMEGDEEYEAFKKKFEKALTTDDCYTPPAVYDAIRDFVDRKVYPLAKMQVVRPFYPGGNYEDLAQYKEDSIVIDNPPFSLLSKIIRFYDKHRIPFFIFAPSLTLFSAPDCDVCYIIADADIEYENGAKVRTGFITNLLPEVRIWVCPELHDSIEKAQETEDKTKRGFVYPDNIVTSATLGKLAAHATELVIKKYSCEYIRESDSAKEQGRGLYGGGFILSERAAAERAAATKLNLSQKERELIDFLKFQEDICKRYPEELERIKNKKYDTSTDDSPSDTLRNPRGEHIQSED